MKKTVLLFTVFLGFAFCGNPAIKYYLVKAAPVQPEDEKKAGVKTAATTEKKSNDDNNTKTITLYEEKDNYKIDLVSIQENDIDELAEKLALYPGQKYYRLPGLNYFKFKISTTRNLKPEKNSESSKITFDLFESYFEDELGNRYKAVDYNSYKKIYTSTAYLRFDYDYMYSFYYIKEPGKDTLKDKFYTRRSRPGKNVELGRESDGWQIIPYQLFSEGSRKYTFYLPLRTPDKTIEVKFYYRSKRADHED